MNKIPITVLCFLALAWPSSWSVHSNPVPIYDLQWGGQERGLCSATGGGIRCVSSRGDQVFTSKDGLEETAQAALTFDSTGTLYAVSYQGILSRLLPGSSRFEVMNRSLVEYGGGVRGRAMTVHGSVLLLRGSKRISFFDLKEQRFLLSLDKIGSLSLTSHQPTALSIRGDSLFVAVDSVLFVRAMKWDSLAADRFLADPQTWSIQATANDPIQSFFWSGDSLIVDVRYIYRKQVGQAVHELAPGARGWFLWQGDSVYNASFWTPGTGDNTIPDTLNPFVMDYDSIAKVYYIADSNSIYRASAGTWQVLPWSGFSLTKVSTLGFSPRHDVVAIGWPWMTTLLPNDLYTQSSDPFSLAFGSGDQMYAQPLKTATSLGSYFLLGTWGGGVLIFRENNGTLEYVKRLHPFEGSCMEAWNDFGFTVIRGIHSSPEKDMAFITYWGLDKRGFGIAYLDSNLNEYCISNIGQDNAGGNLDFYYDSLEQNYVVFASHSISNNNHRLDGGLNIFRFSDPRKTGQFVMLSSQDVQGASSDYALDMAWNEEQQRLWMVGVSSLFYWESGLDSLQTPLVQRGFSGGEFSGIEVDLKGRLWLSTRDQGVYVAQLSHDSPDTLDFSNYGERNGLLSQGVNDLKIETEQGQIYFAHDYGVSILSDVSVRNASHFMTGDSLKPIVYPMPFRPGEHDALIFDYVGEDGDVMIFDARGQPIRSFSGENLAGGRLSWDGKLKNGKRIAPGLYRYVIRQNKRIFRGRFLVIY